MLASKAVLSAAIGATFASGALVGYAVHGTRDMKTGLSTDPNVIYAPYIEKLEAQGYDAAEMAEVRRIYADYHEGYDRWWREFLDKYAPNLDTVETKREKALEALEKKHRERAGTK
jgi:hypothetical protein